MHFILQSSAQVQQPQRYLKSRLLAEVKGNALIPLFTTLLILFPPLFFTVFLQYILFEP